MSKLPKNIQDFYARQSMDEKSIDRILKLGTVASAPPSELGSTTLARSGSLIWGTAITASLVLALLLQFVWLNNEIPSQVGVTQRVLEEIHMNHQKALQVEYAENDYLELSRSMDRLGFTLSPPKAISVAYTLIGGRYCSIQGKIAAQLKIRDKVSSKNATLYVTPFNPTLDGVQFQRRVYGQADIKLWKSEGHFYGLAQDLN